MAKNQTPNWLPIFLQFVEKVSVPTKENGNVPIQLYTSQKILLREIAKGLEDGCHYFVCLKARQLGISSILELLDIFWMYLYSGLQGALIFDTQDNKEKQRLIISSMLDSLPNTFKVPIKRHNRNALQLVNGSTLDYLSAGKGKNSGLGRSRALNYVHGSEISSWGDQAGVDSLKAALAEQNPNRLFVFESTALGFNVFYDMYREAEQDGISKRAIFIGWWAKETYRLERGSEEFERYWGELPQMSEYETEVTGYVLETYGLEIDEEQWAWYRKKQMTQGEDSLHAEYPSTKMEAFVSTGSSFFSNKRVTNDINFIYNNKVGFSGFLYKLGDNYLKTEIIPVSDMQYADLRVWEAPKRNGKYVIGVDGAFGSSEENDRNCVSVWRCFSDHLVQVAEFASSITTSQQCAWVLAHLAGAYRDCMVNLEINGPGRQIMDELKFVKQQIQMGTIRDAEGSLAPADALNNMRWFMWKKPDQMSGVASVYNFQTTFQTKVTAMNRLRDAYNQNQLIIKSIPLLDEMSTLRQNGDSIGSSGRNKDDRVIGCMLANYAWIEWMRIPMMGENRTFEREMADQAKLEMGNAVNIGESIVGGFLKKRAEERSQRELMAILEGNY